MAMSVWLTRTITLINHNLTNQQMNSYPKLLEEAQFQSSLALNQLDNLMKFKPHIKLNQLNVCMCFASQGLDYITNDWSIRNLNKHLALALKSISAYFTSFNEVHALTINDICK